jgi:hypothetical protein
MSAARRKLLRNDLQFVQGPNPREAWMLDQCGPREAQVDGPREWWQAEWSGSVSRGLSRSDISSLPQRAIHCRDDGFPARLFGGELLPACRA